jgi:hypothetical protein
MTISTEIREAGPFTGNGITTLFPFAFKVFEPTDLLVVTVDNSTGVETTLVYGTDYSVSLNLDQNSNAGGNITLTTALATGYNMVITTDIEILQPVDLTNQGGFYPSVINTALDRLTILSQQLSEAVNRSLVYPVSDPVTGSTLPAISQRAGVVLTFNEAGEPIAGPSVASVGTVAGNIANINTVADNIADVNTVAGISGDVSATAAISADIVIVADNIVDIQNAEENADAAAASAALANDWATKTSGPVAGGEYSAKYHAQAAASSASDASTSATDAQTAQSAAEAARDQTLAAFDNFDDRYLGTKTSDPTVDNDGNPLVAGALYFNSVSGIMKVYTGTTWVAAYVSGEGFVANTGDTGSAVIPTGTTAERDGTPSTGYFRFNTSLGKFEGYNGSAWGAVGGGATGGGSDAVFVENDQVITANYTIPVGKNAMSTGPVTINAGVVVTVSAGSTWAVI